MKNYATYSFWLAQCDDDLTPRPALSGSVDVDVAILGAGFSGLWTAYYLLKRDPSLKVAILEAEIAGFGASGRNGGWCYSGFPSTPGDLMKHYGRATARAVSLAMIDSVNEVGAVCKTENIDAHYAKDGSLRVARAPYDMPLLEAQYNEYRAIGLDDRMQLLDRNQLDQRVHVAKAVGAFYNPESAAIQPARLARGLARAVERLGATLYEQTRVTSVVTGAGAKLVTAAGEARARLAIVLAGEAYLSQLPGMERAILPVTSHMVITEPLPAEIMRQIGWQGRTLLGGLGTTGAYIQRTADDRIALGPYRGTYPYRSRITDEIDRDGAIFSHGQRSVGVWFPPARGARFVAAWGGVFGMNRDHLPSMTFDPATRLARAYGYSGQGVSTANLSGRVLGALLTGHEDEFAELPMTRRPGMTWEPEPIRWLGVTFVRKARQKALVDVEKTGRYPERKSLAQRLYNY